MHKDTRKLIKLGETSKAVVLPKPWLEGIKDEFGEIDEVEIISNGGSIEIIPIKKIKAEV